MNEQRIIDALRASSTDDHLGEDTWEALACGELTEDERVEALDHITSCAECDRIFRALRHLHEHARAFDPEAPERAPGATPIGADDDGSAIAPVATPGRRAIFAGIGLAAAALLAIVVLLPRSTPPDPGTTVLRNGAGEQTGPTPVPLYPAGSLIEPPTSLAWTPVTDAESYRVEIYDVAGDLLWSAVDLQTTEIPWPQVDLDAARAWRVFAVHSGGLRQSSSWPVEIELSSPGAGIPAPPTSVVQPAQSDGSTPLLRPQ